MHSLAVNLLLKLQEMTRSDVLNPPPYVAMAYPFHHHDFRRAFCVFLILCHKPNTSTL